MDDERLRQRIVVGLDALPVPRAPQFRPGARSARVFPRHLSFAGSVAVAVLVAGLVIAAPMLTGGEPGSPSKVSSITDSFSSGIDRARWNVVTQGRGPTVIARAGGVELSLPSEATGGAEGSISASLQLQRCVANGNYVAVIEYAILEWPALHGAEIVFGELPPNSASITRDQYADVDSIHGRSDVRDFRQSISASTGALRLSRQEGSVTVSYREGNGPWQELPEVRWTSDGGARFQIGLASGPAAFGGKSVRIAVDNFDLKASQIVCG